MRPLVTLTACVTLSLAAPTFAAELNIMPIGDSITSGFTYLDPDNNGKYVSTNEGYGWRAELESNLVSAGHNPTFVGSQSGGFGTHEGHSGWKIDNAWDTNNNDGVTGALTSWTSDLASADVIILGIGINDIRKGRLNGNGSVDSAIDRYKDMLFELGTILASNGNSDAHVILTTLLPVEENKNPFGEHPGSGDAVNDDIDAFNAQLLAMFAGWDDGSELVASTFTESLGTTFTNFRLANAHSAITDTASMLWQSVPRESGGNANDYLHPTDLGYSALANFYSDRVLEVIPEPATLVLLGLGTALAFGRRRVAA